MGTGVREVGGRIHAREFEEFLDEVRLVVVPARERHVRPFDLALLVDLSQYALEPADPAEDFWREANLGGEEIQEPAVADAEPVRLPFGTQHPRRRTEWRC